MLCDSLDGREVWGEMDTCMCMTESLHCSPETMTTLLTGTVNWLCVCANSLQGIQLCAMLQTGASKAPWSMGFSRQEYRSGLPCPPPEGSF